MLHRSQKQQIINELTEKLSSCRSIYMIEFMGVDVNQLNELREKIKRGGGYVRVVKNTLLAKAIEQLSNGYKQLTHYLKGPTCLIISHSPSEPARVLLEIRKSIGEEKLKLKAAWIEHMIFVGDEKLKELSQLKSREELLTVLASMVRLPYQSVVSALRGPYVRMANALKLLAEKSSGQG